MTVAPACASPRAIARPRPEPPPVTSARRPDRSKGWVEPRGSSEGLAQAEHVLHVENAGRSVAALGGHEARRSQRAMREVRARASLVRELDSFASAREDDGVIAHDV